MSTGGRLFPMAVALLAAAAMIGAPPPAAPASGSRCPQVAGNGTVPATALAVPVPLAGCELADVVVAVGGLAVRVPRREGEWVTAAGTARGAHPAALTVARSDGLVGARVWRPDGDPAPPARRGIERFGRAERPPAPGATDPPVATDPPAAGGPAGTPPGEATDARCSDGAGAWLGMRWEAPYRWLLRPRGTPAYLGPTDDVRAAVREAARAIDDGRNDCGFTGGLGMTQRYAGETDRDADIRSGGTCGHRDERNVVAFGELNGGLLALTCLWWSRGRTVEADVRISDTPGMFTLNAAAGCGDRWDLQGTLTHEFGHVFGLGHVSYAEHGDLTMSDGLPACSARFRSLGLGDFQTLRSHYGAD